MGVEDSFKQNGIAFQETEGIELPFFKAFSEKVKNYLKCMGKTIKLHETIHGSVLTTLYSVKDIINSQETICSENDLLVIGNGANGDLLTINLQNNHVGYVFHDDLWEENYDDIEDIYCELPFEIEAFIKMALEDESYPVDGTMAEEMKNRQQ